MQVAELSVLLLIGVLALGCCYVHTKLTGGITNGLAELNHLYMLHVIHILVTPGGCLASNVDVRSVGVGLLKLVSDYGYRALTKARRKLWVVYKLFITALVYHICNRVYFQQPTEQAGFSACKLTVDPSCSQSSNEECAQ